MGSGLRFVARWRWMGVVYAAYDPELDRKVALKLLLPGVGGNRGSTRLLREAQALEHRPDEFPWLRNESVAIVCRLEPSPLRS